MKRVLKELEELVWPRGVVCLCCGGRSFGQPLCRECREMLDALPARERPDGVVSAWEHTGVARQLVIGLKHRCMADCARVLAEGIVARMDGMQLPSDTLLTWVTMPGDRLRERGIDHGRVLCEAVAARTGLPCRQTMMRVGKIGTQQGLNAQERLQNLRGTIRGAGPLKGTVILIDDVVTTGATAQACRAALLSCGAQHVVTITATSAMHDE